MLKRLRRWLGGRPAAEHPPPGPVTTGTRQHPPATMSHGQTPDVSPASAARDPNQAAPVQRKFVRESTGTYETLKILDDSIIEDSSDDDADPYNTGGFDRSKNWDKRFSNK